MLSTSPPARGLPIWRRPIRARRQMESGRFPELLVHYARGLLCLAGQHLPQALSAFHAAERMQALLVERHALATEVRARMLQTQLALGDIATVRAGLDAVGDEQRDRAETRIAAAALHLAEGEPDDAVEALEPVIDRQAKSMHPLWPVIEASLSDAVAREQLRDHRGAEQSVERALEFAEPEGVVLPFLVVPVRGLLERHPRHRTAHATLLRDILTVLGGSSAPARGEPAPLIEELSEAELRVVRYLPSNLKAPEIAAELVVSPNTVRTHIPPHLRGARSP